MIGTANILAGVHGIAAIVTRRSLPPTSARETSYVLLCVRTIDSRGGLLGW